jgi:hypothetical protein
VHGLQKLRSIIIRSWRAPCRNSGQRCGSLLQLGTFQPFGSRRLHIELFILCMTVVLGLVHIMLASHKPDQGAGQAQRWEPAGVLLPSPWRVRGAVRNALAKKIAARGGTKVSRAGW